MPAALDIFLDALERHGIGVRQRGNEHDFCCPAHDDQHASASATNGHSGLAIKCQAGCKADDIIAAVGLTWPMLLSANGNGHKPEKSRIVATYDYTDEDGELLYQAVRFEPKKFAQRRPDGNGGWIWNLDGVRRVLYGSPVYIWDSVDDIWIAEGEKDVEALRAAGKRATCNPMGAGKWSTVAGQARQLLQDGSITIVADKDEAGRKHALDIYHSLADVAHSIRIVEAAVGKDAYDHLAAGKTLDQFVTVELDQPQPEVETEAEEDVLPGIDGHRYSDAGNAQRLITAADGLARYVPIWGKWMIFADGHWRIDHNETRITTIAKRVAHNLYARINDTRSDDDRKRLIAWAAKSEEAGRIAAMIKLARGEPGIVLDNYEIFDSKPWLFNVRNGTVDLTTGTFKPADPNDYLMMQADVDYNADAEATLWHQCLEVWQPDPIMRAYLQREAGASATGHPTEHCIIHIGKGGNGKSKYFGAITKILGPYAV